MRQDRLMETQMLGQMKADLEQRVAKEAEARAGVADYMQQINQASVLEQDYERVKAREEQERKAIVKGIQEAGGSYQKFLLGNGASIMASYRNNLMNSDEMRKAVNNKLVFAQASLDDYLGRVQRPVYDDNGERMPWKMQMEKFKNGETDILRYEGSVQPVDMIKVREAIQNTYGKDRYKKQSANKEDVKRIMMELGAEDWMAEDAATGYGYGVEAGAEPIYWKQDEMPRAPRASLTAKDLMDAMVDPDMYGAYLRGGNASNSSVYTRKDGDKKSKVVYAHSSVNDPLLDKLFNSSYVLPMGEGRYKYKNVAIDERTGRPIDLGQTPITFGKDDVIDYVNAFGADEEGNPVEEEGKFMRVKVDLPQSAEKSVAQTWWGKNAPNFMFGGTEGGLQGGKGTIVLIPIDDSPINVAADRFTGTDEERYQNLFLDKIMELQGEGF